MTAVLVALMVSGLAGCSKPGASAQVNAGQPASVLTVTAIEPQAQTWPQLVQASGPFAAWQEVIVTPETGGLQLIELKADVGAQVKRGQLLARLADDSLRNDQRKQEAAVAQASAALEQAQSNLRRARMAEDSGALSAQKIEEYRIAAETSRASLDSARAELDSIRLKLSQTRVIAADDGIVSSKSAVLGNVVNAGDELFRLVRQSRVEWRPELDAQQLEIVKPGRVAHVTLADGRVVQGEVRLVSPTLSPNTGRGTAYVSLPIESGARPGTFGSGSIELGNKPALTVPAGAVVLRDGRAYVFLLGSDSKVMSRPVAVGRRRGERVEILSGLDADARVVGSGGAFLSDGAYVTVATTQPSAGASDARERVRR
ncbi:efflux RND transporter periplasmic adaptor subunit [Variovorax gossypii]|uniref:Efflux RND transporter periplasmic adaptor subunit n=2 Tax=Comamonadaceae TaxID=80864 RepID=A0A3S0JY23_9BURK|nr:efflux RND transporter periplasmic adaptor subunit [Variovorax gossypii]